MDSARGPWFQLWYHFRRRAQPEVLPLEQRWQTSFFDCHFRYRRNPNYYLYHLKVNRYLYKKLL